MLRPALTPAFSPRNEPKQNRLDVVSDSWLDRLQNVHQFLVHSFLSLGPLVAPDKRAWLLKLGFTHVLPVTLGSSSSTVNERATSNLACSGNQGFNDTNNVTSDSL